MDSSLQKQAEAQAKQTHRMNNNNLLLFKRTDLSNQNPTVVETNLPGHCIQDELSDDYPSYLISTPPLPSTITRESSSYQPAKIKRNWLEQAKKHKEKGNSLYR